MKLSRPAKFRKKAGLTQTEIAVVCDCDKSWIGMLEQGKITNKQIKRIIKYARACGSTVENIFDY